MKNTLLIIGMLAALIIGGIAGYAFGKGGKNINTDQAKKLEESAVMMKEQSTNIRKMGEMMKSTGMALQEIGMKYKDDDAVVKGKDLQTVGEKYLADDKKAAEGTDSMKKTME